MLDAYPGNVVFASDYPHPDATFPGSVARVAGSTELTPAQVRAVCRANALRLYGLPDDGGPGPAGGPGRGGR
jgi:predicted TIM-barrel fold metal-dependent hydrolase